MADEFSDKLNAVLGDPEAMGQIMSIARALTGDGGQPPPPTEEPAPPQSDRPVEPSVPAPITPTAPVPPQPAAPQLDLSSLMGMLGQLSGGQNTSAPTGSSSGNPLSALADIDPRLIQTGMKLLSEYNSTDDRKTALLTALRPFVKEERFAKVDRAIQLAKLSRVIRIALHVFKDSGGGEQEHV